MVGSTQYLSDPMLPAICCHVFLKFPAPVTLQNLWVPFRLVDFFHLRYDLRAAFGPQRPEPQISTETVKNTQHIFELLFATLDRVIRHGHQVHLMALLNSWRWYGNERCSVVENWSSLLTDFEMFHLRSCSRRRNAKKPDSSLLSNLFVATSLC